MKTGIYIALLILAFLGGIATKSYITASGESAQTIERDTVIVHDTIYPPVPKPETIAVVRYDTVRMPQTSAERTKEQQTPTTLAEARNFKITQENEALIPITLNTYKTENYTAIVEGHKPRLVSMELYPKTTTITNTITNTHSPRWALTVGPSIGYGRTAGSYDPYIGVSLTLGFVIWSK